MTHPYIMPGLEIAVLRGRENIFAQICRDLTKPTPDHVSIVGPRYFGKTTLIHALSAHFRAPASHYQLVCDWDLRHETPNDDAAFKNAFAKLLDTQLVSIGRSDFHDYLNPGENASSDVGGMIEDVVDSLKTDGIRILVLLDDFDRLAQEIQITKNLWDYLRSLAQRSNLRFVTTSRRGLRELIPSRESRTSDFWNIFGNRLVLPPFDQGALTQMLEPLVVGGYTIDDSARKELLNWTGGVPVLAAALCRAILDSLPPGPISKPQADLVAESFMDAGRDILGMLWDDCDQEAQGDLIDLGSTNNHTNDLPDRRRRFLFERGYLRIDGPKLRPGCRLIAKYAGLQEGSARDIRDLLKDEDTEKRSMRRLLEIKLAQIDTDHLELRGYVQHAIAGLNGGTRTALISIRSVAEEALSIAWESEFPGNVIHADVQRQLTASWEQGGANVKPEDLSNLENSNIRRRLLRLAAGAEGRLKVTKKVSRPLMLLIEYLHKVGDFGQHMKDVSAEHEAPADFGFCTVACLAAIALLKRLSDDLAATQSVVESDAATLPWR